MQQYLSIALLCLFPFLLIAQKDNASLSGIIRDLKTQEVIENVSVFIQEKNIYTESDESGFFELEIPSDEALQLNFSRLDYEAFMLNISPLEEGTNQTIEVELNSILSDIEIIVRDNRVEQADVIREDMSRLVKIPTTGSNIENLLPAVALGLNSGTGGELSSQYNVRGGNFDENLVYVNDFEIFRPQLITSSLQEGLSFTNLDLVENFTFSSGGFQSNYGDKLSSVMDIQYKKPQQKTASLGLSLQGATAHIGGSVPVSTNRDFTYLIGVRYKTNQFLYQSLDTDGDYQPNFADAQAYLTFDLTNELELAALFNYNYNQYKYQPRSRTTRATIPKSLTSNFQPIDFNADFEGEEITNFDIQMAGVSLNYIPAESKFPWYIKLLTSYQTNQEKEKSDLLSFYELLEIDADLSSPTFNEPIAILGTGTDHVFSNNTLTSIIGNIQLKGGLEFRNNESKSNFIKWGLKYQNESHEDVIDEWRRLNPDGYTLPFDPESIAKNYSLESQNNLSSNRYTAYLQNTFKSKKDSLRSLQLSTGIRAAFWDLNEEFFVSPRAQILLTPLKSNRSISYKLATGLYYQSPFYREMRAVDGQINTNLLAQKSWHVVGGFKWNFEAKKVSEQKISFIAEAYYKELWDLVSYELDDVRIRYAAENNAMGYATGIDMRISGNLAPNTESWISLSLMRTRESINGIQHKIPVNENPIFQEVADVPRPNDKYINLSIFIQDYLPRNERIKAYLNFILGSGLPYGIEGDNLEFRNIYIYATTSQLNLGTVYTIWDRQNNKGKKNPFSFTQNTWIGFDVINLLNVRNVAYNSFVEVSNGQTFFFPNYLTSRTFNVRFRMEI